MARLARISEAKNMRRSVVKTIVAALFAAVVALGSTSPSSAFGGFHGGMGGFHGGMGGFHGGMGGFHGGMGGFHPGFRPGFVGFHPGFHPFFNGRRAFFFHHHHFFRNAVFVNGAVIGGGWWGGWDGYDSCWSYRPVYDASGAYLGYNYVNLCY
jgi:hypothetical protein